MLDGLSGAGAVWHSYRLSVYNLQDSKMRTARSKFLCKWKMLSRWVVGSQHLTDWRPSISDRVSGQMGLFPRKITSSQWVRQNLSHGNGLHSDGSLLFLSGTSAINFQPFVDVTVKSDWFPGPNPRQGDHFLSVHRSGCFEQRQQTWWTMDFTMAPLEWSTQIVSCLTRHWMEWPFGTIWNHLEPQMKFSWDGQAI